MHCLNISHTLNKLHAQLHMTIDDESHLSIGVSCNWAGTHSGMSQAVLVVFTITTVTIYQSAIESHIDWSIKNYFNILIHMQCYLYYIHGRI